MKKSHYLLIPSIISLILISVSAYVVRSVNEVGGEDKARSVEPEEYVSEVFLDLSVGDGPYQVAISKEDRGVGPNSIAIDKRNNVYILDTVNFRILKYNEKGAFLGSFKTAPRRKATGTGNDICVGSDGKIYLLNTAYSLLKIFNPDGTLLGKFSFPNRREFNDSGHQVLPQLVMINEHDDLFLGDRFDSYPVTQIDEVSGKITLGNLQGGTPSSCKSKRHSVLKEDTHTFVINKVNNDGKSEKQIKVSSEGLATGYLIKDDEKTGHSYIFLTTHDEHYKKVKRVVQKYDMNGLLVATTGDMPYGDIYVEGKSVAVDSRGNIYYLLVNLDGAKVIRWFSRDKKE